MDNNQARAEALVSLAMKLGLGRVTVEHLPASDSWAVHFDTKPEITPIYGEPGPGSYSHVRAQLHATKIIRGKKFTGLENPL